MFVGTAMATTDHKEQEIRIGKLGDLDDEQILPNQHLKFPYSSPLKSLHKYKNPTFLTFDFISLF